MNITFQNKCGDSYSLKYKTFTYKKLDNITIGLLPNSIQKKYFGDLPNIIMPYHSPRAPRIG